MNKARTRFELRRNVDIRIEYLRVHGDIKHKIFEQNFFYILGRTDWFTVKYHPVMLVHRPYVIVGRDGAFLITLVRHVDILSGNKIIISRRGVFVRFTRRFSAKSAHKHSSTAFGETGCEVLKVSINSARRQTCPGNRKIRGTDLSININSVSTLSD